MHKHLLRRTLNKNFCTWGLGIGDWPIPQSPIPMNAYVYVTIDEFNYL